MSERAIAWAGTARNHTPAQREVLQTLAAAADEDGVVRGAYKLLERHPGTLTPHQAKKAAEALVQARTMAYQRWNMDTYVWDFYLVIT